MFETQSTISEWAETTFGYCKREAAINRMLQEVEELKKIDLYNLDSFNKMSDECADILITLYRIADCYSFDLHKKVDHKMAINRGRKWKSNGDGTGQHIKE
jgi:hypothetical protein